MSCVIQTSAGDEYLAVREQRRCGGGDSVRRIGRRQRERPDLKIEELGGVEGGRILPAAHEDPPTRKQRRCVIPPRPGEVVRGGRERAVARFVQLGRIDRSAGEAI